MMKNYNNQMLRISDKSGFAIPAFNYSDLWEFDAIIRAAKAERSNVYVASNMRVVGSHGIGILGALGAKAHELSGGHVINHLDHSNSIELCKLAVDAGYHSVMIDASMYSLEENIERVVEVVSYAHNNGVLVEAEIGRILGKSNEGNYQGEDYLVSVADAVKLAERTGVDSLAVGIGTAHGFYKEEPKINIQRLREVNDAVSIPLVLHGGTGVPPETIRSCIKNGIAKVNVGTLLHATYINELRKQLVSYQGTSISDLMEPVREAIVPKVQEWIRVCGSQNSY
ncbi:MAG: class II fructose-bisphosphate aldolase family protein [Oscillospiraceae bacterium]|nr:class II fructose-bisphosphate aldolase family protein [Oscillospiraceae bacterium]